MAHPGAILTVSSYSAPTAPVSLAPGRDAFARPPGASFFTVFVKELKIFSFQRLFSALTFDFLRATPKRRKAKKGVVSRFILKCVSGH